MFTKQSASKHTLCASPCVRVLIVTALFAFLQNPNLDAQVSTAWSVFDGGVAMAVDHEDNIFTLNFEMNLGKAMTLTKRDVNGNLLWRGTNGPTSSTTWERASWVTVDSQGHAIVCGTMMSGFSNPVPAASIVMKFSANGTLLWRHVYESAFDGSSTRRCVVDAADDVYVLGLGIGPAGLVTKIKKFSATGVPLWNYFDSDGIGSPLYMKVSPDQHLLVCGRSITGSLNGYSKIDLNGNRVWSLSGISSLTTGDLAGDMFGDTYLLHGDFGPTPAGCVVKKLSPTGSTIYSQNYTMSGFRIEVGPDQQPVVSGFPNSTTGGAAFFKTSTNGNLLWMNLDGDGPGFILLTHAQMIVDESNDIYLAAGILFQAAVCKVNADGSNAWTHTFSGNVANGIARSANDRSLFAAGGIVTTRILDTDEGPWVNLGGGVQGQGGTPFLRGEGSFAGNSIVALSVRNAVPFASLVMVVGSGVTNTPIFGGTLIPSPGLLVFTTTDSDGQVVLSSPWPAGYPSGFSLFFQSWIADGSAIQGYSSTNGLQAITP